MTIDMSSVHVRMTRTMLVIILALAAAPQVWAQSCSATLTGTVVDGSGAVVPGTAIVLINDATSTQRPTTSTSDGTFIFTTVSPGQYTVRASVARFVPAELHGVVLNVNDHVAVRVELVLASRGEGVTVTAEAQRLSTAPSVSTVIDRQFVENLPLNGRSLQSLLELTPGVVLTPVNDPFSQGGQFSVNGQRTNADYVTVDGVSANVGVSASAGGFPGQSGSGQLPATTTLGGTNGLVSVDALQEFRIQTSTYAPEFGRTPGGQISMVTRSGSNLFHGSLFEYFRHDALDANDWFAKRNGQPKPQLRQHDFGGVLGGPLLRNRTFFFGSYEGLRLEQPLSRVVLVPSLEVRRTAVPAAQTLLNGLPLPNGKDLGGGLAEFAASDSDPSRLNASSVRIDHNAGPRLLLFGRVNHAPSSTTVRGGALSQTATTNQKNTGVTAGSTWILSSRIVHDLRANFTRNAAPYTVELDDFGGAVPPPASIFTTGLTPETALYTLTVLGNGGTWTWGAGTAFVQRQFNIVDSLTVTGSRHEWKFGVDFRRNTTRFSDGNTATQSVAFSIADLSLGRATVQQLLMRAPGLLSVAFDNLSLYAQDNWRVTPRLTLTYGIRWESVLPPRSTEGANAITLANIADPYGGQVHVAPRDTALWDTRYDNWAPRIGASYMVSETPGAQLSIRGGFGIFHDLGFGQVAIAYRTYPFVAARVAGSAPFPPPPDALTPSQLLEDAPQQIWMMDPGTVAPFTRQWNVSAERSLGTRQTLTVGYVGAEGRRLLKLDRYNLRLLEWPTVLTPVRVNRNRGYSDYHALQMQFQRRLQGGIRALAFGQTFTKAAEQGGRPLTAKPNLTRQRSFDELAASHSWEHLTAPTLLPSVPMPRHWAPET